MTENPRILHLHSTFSAGGKELRAVQLMNAFGRDFSHTVVSAEVDAMEAATHVFGGVSVAYPKDFPRLKGMPWPGRLLKLAQAMKLYDLVLTYNWGAMDAVMAHTLFSDMLGLPPLVHHEDGFNEDEQEKLKTSRNWYRRIALGKSSGLVVPSERLEEIALDTWLQPMGRVKLIPNGIPTINFAKRPKPDSLRGIVKRKGEFWVGTMAGLRPVKNLPRLVRAFADMPEEWQLVIVGEGPERNVIRDAAADLNIGHRVHLPGFAKDPAKVVGLFDIFALSSNSEQAPLSLLEAMAAGVPAVAPQVGDVPFMVAEENRPFITPRGDEKALAGALRALAVDPGLRKQLGETNRKKAVAEFDEKAMIAAYRRLYTSAMGRPQPA